MKWLTLVRMRYMPPKNYREHKNLIKRLKTDYKHGIRWEADPLYTRIEVLDVIGDNTSNIKGPIKNYTVPLTLTLEEITENIQKAEIKSGKSKHSVKAAIHGIEGDIGILYVLADYTKRNLPRGVRR